MDAYGTHGVMWTRHRSASPGYWKGTHAFCLNSCCPLDWILSLEFLTREWFPVVRPLTALEEPWQMHDSRNYTLDCSQGQSSVLSTSLCTATCNTHAPWLLSCPCWISRFLELTKEKTLASAMLKTKRKQTLGLSCRCDSVGGELT